MSAQRNYLDTGDRVEVVGNTYKYGSSDLAAHVGKQGVITNNDGFGLCSVLLDDGTRVTAWNAADLADPTDPQLHSEVSPSP